MTNPPSARKSYAQAYDAKRNVITIFGGATYTTDNINETWQADLNTLTWKKIDCPVSPEGRSFAEAVIDSLNDCMYLIGGVAYDAQGSSTTFSVVWKLNLETLTWSKLAYAFGYPTHYESSNIVFDTKERRILFFGGWGTGDVLMNDTYAYSCGSNTWSKLPVSGTLPMARFQTAAAYDGVHHRIICMNGCFLAQLGVVGFGKPVSELWELDLQALKWKKLPFADPAPSPRKGFAFQYLSKADQLISVGGDVSEDWIASFVNEIWRYDMTRQQWDKLVCGGDPVPVIGIMTSNYDSKRSRILFFGGVDNSYYSYTDIYELRLNEDTGVEQQYEQPVGLALFANYPNPFNASTRISFSLPGPGAVRLSIFNLRGQEVQKVLDRPLAAGQHEVLVNGEGLDTGVYFCRIKFGGFSRQMKICLVK